MSRVVEVNLTRELLGQLLNLKKGFQVDAWWYDVRNDDFGMRISSPDLDDQPEGGSAPLIDLSEVTN